MNKVKTLVNQIKTLDLDNLKESDLINIVCTYGLVHSPMDDYGEYSNYQLPDRNFSGIYQTPKQIAQCIMELLKHDIKSYIEIGVFQGGNFLLMSNILKLKNPNTLCVGVDVTDSYLNDDVKPYIINDFVKGTSADFKGINFDLSFIDAGHEYNDVKTDYENVGVFSKITMFHDINNYICPGVEKFWNEIKEGKKYLEFNYQTTGKKTHGIGLIFNS